MLKHALTPDVWPVLVDTAQIETALLNMDLAGWMLPHAIENDRLVHLAGLVVEEYLRVMAEPRSTRGYLGGEIARLPDTLVSQRC
jgi:hypothetical protein